MACTSCSCVPQKPRTMGQKNIPQTKTIAPLRNGLATDTLSSARKKNKVKVWTRLTVPLSEELVKRMLDWPAEVPLPRWLMMAESLYSCTQQWSIERLEQADDKESASDRNALPHAQTFSPSSLSLSPQQPSYRTEALTVEPQCEQRNNPGFSPNSCTNRAKGQLEKPQQLTR